MGLSSQNHRHGPDGRRDLSTVAFWKVYALILAPVMCAGIHPADHLADANNLWMERLGQLALAAVSPDPAGKGPAATRTRKTASSPRSDEPRPPQGTLGLP